MVDWGVHDLVDGVQQAGDILQETGSEDLLNQIVLFLPYIN